MSGTLDSADGPSAPFSDPVVAEAYKRFTRCAEWESSARERFIEDIKFANGDADNGYQWPNAIRRNRDVDARPCLTMNITRQHNLQIVNDARQNPSAVHVIATGNGATREAADVYEALIRHTEYISNAAEAYDVARGFQVDGGIGWWRIVTDWARPDGPNAFDQEVFILPVNDPLSIYMDPDCKRRDCSDATFAFVFDNLPRDAFLEAYPECRDVVSLSPMGVASSDDDWNTKDHVRVAEYFRVVQKEDTVISFIDPRSVGPTGRPTLRRTILASKLPDDLLEMLKEEASTQTRPCKLPIVEWKLIAADRVIDETIWLGKYIPLIKCVGEETVIEGIMDRKGHTRAMKDAQRMVNYNASGQVEFVALQTKTPWVASAKAIEDYESYWNTANSANHSVLPFNSMDDDGNVIPPPERVEPPAAAPAYEAGMQTAFNQLMMVSGQWQNQMGMQGNERTGEAISQRQEQGDTATYHFRNHYEEALLTTGRQLIDLYPRIYDTNRVIRIQAEDGEDYELTLDPSAQAAFEKRLAYDQTVAARIFNPNVGDYDVVAAPGMAFGTRREQTVKALTLILTQAPALTGILGDLLLRAMDFKDADEAAARMKRMVPPQALGEGPSQNEQLLQQQLTQLQGLLAKALQESGKEKLKLVGKDQMRDIDVYKAETDRFKALAPMLGLDQGGIQQVLEQLIEESMTAKLGPILQANAASGDDGTDGAPGAGAADKPINGAPGATTGGPAPVPGARQAPDGEWYLQDPTRRGKYLRVAPLAQERSPKGVIGNA